MTNSQNGIVTTIIGLAIVLPSLAVAVRRLHDTSRSGWWLLIGLIPVIGTIILIVFWVQDSHGDNQYGPSPKAVGSAAAPEPAHLPEPHAFRLPAPGLPQGGPGVVLCGPSGGARSGDLGHPLGHHRGDAVAAHRHAVERVGDLHGPLLVGDDDELAGVAQLLEEQDQPAEVGVVERRLHLVEDVERRRPGREDRRPAGPRPPGTARRRRAARAA